jgi:hypothetical protein
MQHSQEEERENVKINPRMARIKKRKKKGEGLKLKLRRKEREGFIPSVCVLRIDSIELIHSCCKFTAKRVEKNNFFLKRIFCRRRR